MRTWSRTRTSTWSTSPHPTSEHRDHALLALQAGKPVLVEKSFTRNAGEAREVLDASARHGLFAMEAMWTRFLPHMDVVRQAVETGLLGEVLTVMADHGQLLHPDGPERLSSPHRPAARCSTSGSTRCPSRPWSWAPSRRSPRSAT